jgi:hypothetical protein
MMVIPSQEMVVTASARSSLTGNALVDLPLLLQHVLKYAEMASLCVVEAGWTCTTYP